MKSNIFFNRENWLLFFLFLFSLLINQYYGNKGIFPIDGFGNFDAGFRILLGEHPFKDYWVNTGPIIDYIQATFFYLFGISWQTYVLHASILNAILTITTFIVLRKFKLNIFYSFLYSLFFSILAYPSSGTPFVDHHSAFFSLLGIYFLILSIKEEKKIYFILFPLLFGIAFLSKQTPAAYIILFSIIILILYSIALKNFFWIKYSLISSLLFIFFLFTFGIINGINLNLFLDQYLFFPKSIGEQRFENLSFSFRGVIDHFKFIYLSFLPIFYINIKNIFLKKNYFKEKEFLYFLILFTFFISLLFHQLLTKNQTFIFFLIPILTAFSQISLSFDKTKLNSFLCLTILLICLFATIKYHQRYNQDRKFHELSYVDFSLSDDAGKIDDKLSGLKWITPDFKENPAYEISLINETKVHLKNDKRKKMLMTNYSFFSIILNEKLYYPGRWYSPDGTTHPLKGNKYFDSYKNLLIKLIKENKIDVIYIVNSEKNLNITDNSIYDYINKECFEKTTINNLLTSFELKNCNEING